MKYKVMELRMNPVEVMDAICDGLNDMSASAGTINGRVGVFLIVDDSCAELVEEAARRQNVKLEKVT